MRATLLGQIFPEFINRFFDFLAIKVLDSKYLVIMPGWLIVHALFVFFGYYLIKFKLKEEKPVLLTILFIFIVEIMEFIISYIIPIILKEVWQDTLFDILLGLFILLIAWLIFRKKKV